MDNSTSTETRPQTPPPPSPKETGAADLQPPQQNDGQERDVDVAYLQQVAGAALNVLDRQQAIAAKSHAEQAERQQASPKPERKRPERSSK